VLNGGLGIDTLDGADGNDTYELNAEASGIDVITDVSGTDTIRSTITRSLAPWDGVIENLSLVGSAAINGVGSAGINALVGNGAANALAGGAGNDTIGGQGGNDRLFGQGGKDTLKGGAGNDDFVYQLPSDSKVGNIDIILDFDDSGNDRIDLQAVYGPALEFLPNANAAFTAPGQVRINDSAATGADVHIEVNLTGNSGAEMVIILSNTTAAMIGADDFLL
jgi:Ca2+-binding RTX toxin-like protein